MPGPTRPGRGELQSPQGQPLPLLGLLLLVLQLLLVLRSKMHHQSYILAHEAVPARRQVLPPQLVPLGVGPGVLCRRGDRGPSGSLAGGG